VLSARSAVPRNSTCCKQNWAILRSLTNSQACITDAALWPRRAPIKNWVPIRPGNVALCDGRGPLEAD